MAQQGTAKLKMSNRAFRTLLVIPMVVIALLAVIATVAGGMMGSTLDTYVGKGEAYIEAPADSADVDADYYAAGTAATTEGSN